MSAIHGCFGFAAAGIDPSDLRRMETAMRHRGPDGTQHWHDQHAGLGFLLHRTSSSDRLVAAPFVDVRSDVVAVLDGRIHNVVELLREIARAGGDGTPAQDTEILVRAYRLWDEEFADRLVGEFAFAIWDGRRRYLLAGRDVAGTRTLHWRVHDGRIWIATEIRALLAVSAPPPRLDRGKVLDFLVAEHDRDHVASTFHEGIQALEQGHLLACDGSGARTRRYWFPERLQAEPMSRAEAARGLLEQIDEAVRCRLNAGGTTAGALLSGGLDSSTIAAVARRHLAGRPLTTVSLVKPGEDCPERRAIAAVADQGGLAPALIETTCVRSHAAGFLDAIGDWDDPFIAMYGFHTWLAFRKARSLDCDVLLEGMGGDLLFHSLTRSMEIALQRFDLNAIRKVHAAHRRHGLWVPQFVSPVRLVGTFAPDWLLVGARRFRPKDRHYAVARPGETAGDNTPRMRKAAIADMLVRNSAKQASVGATEIALHSKRWIGASLSFGHALEGTLAAHHCIEERSPLSDRRVMEFCLRMPLEAKLGAGWYKGLLREATAGLLPDAVRWRQDIGTHPGSDFREALIDAIPMTHPLLLSPERIAATLDEWIDPDATRASFIRFSDKRNVVLRENLLALALLAEWLDTRF